MEDNRRGSTHPEREFQSMGLPLSFGNSNSRQARAATAAASRRPLDDAHETGSVARRPPPPPSQLFKQPPMPFIHSGAHHVPNFQQEQRSVQNSSIAGPFSPPPPPPATVHIQPSLHQHQNPPYPHSHVRAKPYGSSADGGGRKRPASCGRQPDAAGPRMNPEYLFKDSMFGNPWRGCAQGTLRSA